MLSLLCQSGEVCMQGCEGEIESKREKAEISIRGEDYPVKRLPATWSSSPPLTHSLTLFLIICSIEEVLASRW